MIPMVERARDFFMALLNPRKVRPVAYSPSQTMCPVYRRRGFWSLQLRYKGHDREAVRTIVAAILEDYMFYLKAL